MGDSWGGGGGSISSSSSSIGSSSLTYWEAKYGDLAGSSSGYGGGPPSSVIDGSAFERTYTQADKALAWLRLVVAITFIVLGTYSLVLLYRSRYILDIRTRSVHLVLLAGSAMVASYLVAVNESILILCGADHSLRWFWSSMLLSSITPIIFGSYLCRALRLAVVFHPRARRALPWLIPERNYMAPLIALGLAYLGVAIYDEYTLQVWEIIPKQAGVLAATSLAFTVCLACIYPFIRKVDDLFNISTELIVVTALLLVLSIGIELVYKMGGDEVVRWAGKNLNFVITAFVFGISVVDPLRRLAVDPLAGTKWHGADRVWLARRESRSTARTTSLCISEDDDDEDALPMGIEGDVEEEDGRCLEEGFRSSGSWGGSARAPTPAEVAARVAAQLAANSSFVGQSESFSQPESFSPSPEPGAPGAGNWVYQGVNFSSQQRGCGAGWRRRRGDAGGLEAWDFERLSRSPPLASAFRDFCRKALCQESVLFLSEVSRYQSGDYSELSGGGEPSQYAAFCHITDMFIRSGSREEIKICGAARKRLLDWTHKGQASFSSEPYEVRRLVFDEAYLEVKIMLEDNLLRRFLQTEEFKSVRAQRNRVTSVLATPPTFRL
ncbi:unnamed protein product [Scytosiphon promiscuus]